MGFFSFWKGQFKGRKRKKLLFFFYEFPFGLSRRKAPLLSIWEKWKFAISLKVSLQDCLICWPLNDVFQRFFRSLTSIDSRPIEMYFSSEQNLKRKGKGQKWKIYYFQNIMFFFFNNKNGLSSTRFLLASLFGYISLFATGRKRWMKFYIFFSFFFFFLVEIN